MNFPIQKIKPVTITAGKQKNLKLGQELEQTLAKLKMREWPSLIHIGMLDNPSQQSASQEGPLLSASNHPETWIHIARLGGNPQWEIQRNDQQPLRLIHLLDKPTQKTILQWGINHQLVEPQTWWWTPTSTGEEGEVYYCWSKNPEDDHDGDIDEKPKKKKVHVPTPALWEFWNQRLKWLKKPAPRTPWHTNDALAAALTAHAGKTLGNQHPLTPDGVFWNEVLNPGILSAPRMGINPHKNLQYQKIKNL